MKSPILKREELELARAERYRQLAELRIGSESEALEFLDSVGISLLFSSQNIELPSLWGALCGQDRLVPKNHDNHELGLAWAWKDKLPIEGKVLYGKFLRKTPVFISLDLAPCFYALSPNYGNPDEDYLVDYHDGRISVEAKQVYETLLEQGALPTSRLRLDAGLGGKANATRFDRALAELQMDFRITKVATSNANRWGYCYVYDLLPRHLPQVVEQARKLSSREAQDTILQRYLKTVVAATPQQVLGLLGWEAADLKRTASRLTERGMIYTEVPIENLKGKYLVAAG